MFIYVRALFGDMMELQVERDTSVLAIKRQVFERCASNASPASPP